MKKIFLVLLFGLYGLSARAEPRNFEMILTGPNGQLPHPNTDAHLRKMIGGFVENLKVKNYTLKDTPVGGGFHVCIEPVEPDGYDYIVGELSTVGVGSSSIWTINLVESCQPLPPPVIDVIEYPGFF